MHSIFLLVTVGFLWVSTYQFTTAEAQSCKKPIYIHQKSQIIIGGVFDVHQPGNGSRVCSVRVSDGGIQRLQAFLFALNKVVREKWMQNISFGGIAYDSCRHPDVTLDRTLEFVSYKQGCHGPVDPLAIGTIGAVYDGATKRSANALTSGAIPDVSYDARPELNDASAYPYFLRTVPDSDNLARIIVDVVKNLDWSAVTVVYENLPIASRLRKELYQLASQRGICVTISIHVTTSTDYKTTVKHLLEQQAKGINGVLLLTGPDATSKLFSAVNSTSTSYGKITDLRWIMGLPVDDAKALAATIPGLIGIDQSLGEVPGFKEYFLGLKANTRSSPWLRQYVEQVNNCKLGVTCTQDQVAVPSELYKQEKYVAETVAAVYTYAYAFRALLDHKCPESVTICDAALRMKTEEFMPYLRNVSFPLWNRRRIRYSASGDLILTNYKILRTRPNGSIGVVGSWSARDGFKRNRGASLKRDNFTTYRPSKCTTSCKCKNKAAKDVYGGTDGGDILIQGIFDVHESGSSQQECGKKLNEASLQAVEAMLYAVDEINMNTSLLPSVNLSAVVVDSCRNSDRTVRQTETVRSGQKTVRGSTEHALPLTAAVDGSTSDVSMSLAKYLSSYKIPAVSFSSTSPLLSDKKQYPTFLRTVPSDKYQTAAIIDILKTLKWSYVSLVFSDNAFGSSAAKEFLRRAKKDNICVATQVKLQKYFLSDKNTMTDLMRFYVAGAYHKSHVVVLFVTDSDAKALLKAMRSNMKGPSNRDIIFIASDFWAFSHETLWYFDKVARGVLALDFYQDRTPNFKTYFKDLRPKTNRRNPWFTEYWQDRHQCHLTSDYAKMYPSLCDENMTAGYVDVTSLVPYTIDAVYAVAHGLHKLIDKHCGDQSGFCQEAKSNLGNLYDEIKTAKFTMTAGHSVSFDVLGDGIPRYTILNYRKVGPNASDYVKVGSWMNEKLSLETYSVLVLSSGVESPTSTNTPDRDRMYTTSRPDKEATGFTNTYTTRSSIFTTLKGLDTTTPRPTGTGMDTSTPRPNVNSSDTNPETITPKPNLDPTEGSRNSSYNNTGVSNNNTDTWNSAPNVTTNGLEFSRNAAASSHGTYSNGPTLTSDNVPRASSHSGFSQNDTTSDDTFSSDPPLTSDDVPRAYSRTEFSRNDSTSSDGTFSSASPLTSDNVSGEYRQTVNAMTPAIHVDSRCKAKQCPCSTEQTMDISYQLSFKDVTLLGFFPLHAKGSTGKGCGAYLGTSGFEQLMAFHYAIEKVNRDADVLPNATVGYVAFDSCQNPSVAAHAYEAFNKGLRVFTNEPELPTVTHSYAFIGGISDDVTKQLHQINLAGKEVLVQISPGSTSDELSDSISYPYLLRTTPPDNVLDSVVTSVMEQFGWTYVSLVYSNVTYNPDGLPRLSEHLQTRGHCVAATQIIEPMMNDTKYDVIIDNLLNAKGAVGVILMTDGQEARQVFQAAERKSAVGKFVWVGGDKIGNVATVTKGLHNVARGMVVISSVTSSFYDFQSYMRNMTPSKLSGNPWFKDYWQEKFQCNLNYGGPYENACTGRESMGDAAFSIDGIIRNTINAVYAFAHGLSNLIEEHCRGAMDFRCIENDRGTKSTDLIYKFMQKVKFTGPDGKPFAFTTDGDGAARFTVVNYHAGWDGLNMVQQEVGEWFNGKLYFNASLVRMYDASGNPIIPYSQCPGTCNCSIRQTELDKTNVPIRFNAHMTIWGILIITLSLLGIVFAIVTMMFFMFKPKHPVVLGSTSSLSVLLLLGIILLYLLNFAFMFSDTWTTCGMRRFGLGFFYAMIFATLLMKIIRINRISNNASLAGKLSFIGGPSQAFCAFILMIVQLVVVGEWLLMRPPDVQWYLVNINSADEYPFYIVEWKCVHTQLSLIISMSYVFLLILLTLILAIKARKAAEFQHEAFFIFLSSLCTLLVLGAWMSVVMLTDKKFTIPAICVGLTVNASLIFAFIFLPKMLELTKGRTLGRAESTDSLEYDPQISGTSPSHRNKEEEQQDMGHINRALEGCEMMSTPL